MSESERAPTWKEPEGNHYGMRRDPDGGWVAVDDYDALRARVAELESGIREYIEVVEEDGSSCCGCGCCCNGREHQRVRHATATARALLEGTTP